MNDIEIGQVWQTQVSREWVHRIGLGRTNVPEDTKVIIKRIDYRWGGLIFITPTGEELFADIDEFMSACEEIT